MRMVLFERAAYLSREAEEEQTLCRVLSLRVEDDCALSLRGEANKFEPKNA